MNNDKINLVKRLDFENIIWICFIIISFSNIYGSKLIKKSILYNDKQAENKANKLFLKLTLLSLIIYIYFFKRNYNDYKKTSTKNFEIRLIGSSLILLGTLCFLYFQLNNPNDEETPSNI